MATPIPGLAAQVIIDTSTDGIQVTSGSAQTLATTRNYYFVSNRTTASNGQSLLKAIKDALDTSLAGTVWTVQLSAAWLVQLSHDNVASRTVTFDSQLATNLGFTSASFAVAASTTVTATNYSRWFWSPDMPVSWTGPVQFDPAVSYGHPTSAGGAQRSSDMTAAYTANGTQYEAEYGFRMVEFDYKIHATSGHTNKDLIGFWAETFRQGRSVLWWRDRDSMVGSNAPTEGSATPYKYIKYNPSDALREAPLFAPTVEGRVTLHDVRFPFWVTEDGETPMSD